MCLLLALALLKLPGLTLVAKGKKESKGLNAAFLTLTSASAKEDVLAKLHDKPPLNLVVTPVASWNDRLGEKQEVGERSTGGEEEDENNNAAEEVFVFGSPVVLDVTCDEVNTYIGKRLTSLLFVPGTSMRRMRCASRFRFSRHKRLKKSYHSIL